MLLDLAGPKIRLGAIQDGALEVKNGDEVVFVRGDTPQAKNQLVSIYPKLIDELTPGDRILLADGTICLEALDKVRDQVKCRVVIGGIIRSKQGINLPGPI